MAFASDLDSSAIIRIPKTLSLTPVKPTQLPQMEELIRDGESILDASMSWKRGKTFGDVETFFCTTVEDSRRWYCRVSQHREEDISFEQFWEKLGRNKILNEQSFRPEIKKVMEIKCLSEEESIWSIYYTCPPPFSPRVFTIFQVVQLDESANKRIGIMVSVPVDLSSSEMLSVLEETGVRGRHVRIERIEEIEDGTMIEWRLVTSEDFGGSLPRFWMERRIPEKMAKDVERFKSWMDILSRERKGDNES